MNKRLSLCRQFTVLLALIPWLAYGQQLTLSGRVLSETGENLPGVSITIKGTTKGTTTDSDGRYSLSSLSPTDQLVYSFVGYQPQTVTVGNRTVLDVTLKPDEKVLSEVVVVGYGTQRKPEITGSIASVKSEDLAITPNANLAQGLQSRVAGIQITQSSAAPGGNVSVRIRGVNSINGTSEPLYVIDGVQIGNDGGGNSPSPLSQINPGDIESMEVLKDATSTSIYGARGANGVIIITTKRGKAGQTQVSYDGYYGVQDITRKLGVLNGPQFAALENEVYRRPVYDDPAAVPTGTDWQSLVFQQAPIQNHQLSLTAGSEKTQLLLSGNYFNQEGIVRSTGYDRYALRLNLDHTLNRIFKTGLSFLGSVNENRGVNTAIPDKTANSTTQGILGATLAAPPTLSPYRPDGSVFPFQDQLNGLYREVINPLGLLQETRRQTARRTLANLYVEANLLKGLTYRASFNLDYTNSLSDFYSPRSILSQAQLVSGGGTASKGNSYSQTLLHESILTYTTKFADQHSLKFTGIFASQRSVSESNTASASLFPNDITTNNALQLGTVRNAYNGSFPTSSDGKQDQRLDSYMGRINYGFRDKLFLDLTLRVDGNSKFGANNKYGFFPAVGAGWRLIEEPFLKNVTWLSDLKLRGSWGITGNAGALGPYQSLARAAQGNNYQFGGVLGIGIVPVGIPNPDLRWERSTQTNLGLDVAFFNNRLSLVADVYEKRTDDLIFVRSLPASSGYNSITGNFGSLQNRGIELAVNARIFDKAVKWDLSGNISINRNKVLSLDGGTTNEVFRGVVSYLVVGQPVGVFKTYVWDGIYQTGDAFIPGDNGRVGGARVKDVNGDGRITNADIIITGNPNPNYIFGITSNLSYKNFDFTAFVQGVQGNDLWNNVRWSFENPLGQRNQLSGMANRWSPTNPSNEYVSGFQGGRLPFANRFVEDGSFIRIKTLTLGYRLPAIKGLRSVRVYVSANNVFTITRYKGFDPEVNTYGGNDSNSLIGIDDGVYPVARTFLGGLQVNF